MSESHIATFTWGTGPETVFVAGKFNEWSATATPLSKLEDGTFSGAVTLPWGEKQAFKYVVDGEWKVREDESKEWDASGNVNNIYTAPPLPLAAIDTVAAVEAPTEPPVAVPAPSEADTPAPVSDATTTQPSELLAASAPAAAGGVEKSAVPELVAEPVTDTAVVPTAVAEPVTVPATEVTSVVQASPEVNGTSSTVYTKAAEYGGAAVAAIGAAAATAAVAVEKATGVDLTHGSPISVDEAKSRGINVDSLTKVDAPTDATSPSGSVPPVGAVAALEEMVDGLKINGAKKDVEINGAAKVPEPVTADIVPDSDLHASVPATIITPVVPVISHDDSVVDVTAPSETTAAEYVQVEHEDDDEADLPELDEPDVVEPEAPATPTKDDYPPLPAKEPFTPQTAPSTAASTPAKSAIEKVKESENLIKKRKSSIFGKIRSVFHSPKEKK